MSYAHFYYLYFNHQSYAYQFQLDVVVVGGAVDADEHGVWRPGLEAQRQILAIRGWQVLGGVSKLD